LVLEFVEGVLRVAPVTVALAQREDFMIEGGDRHDVFIPGHTLAALAVGFDEAQP
jgi:hypothetical protein